MTDTVSMIQTQTVSEKIAAHVRAGNDLTNLNMAEVLDVDEKDIERIMQANEHILPAPSEKHDEQLHQLDLLISETKHLTAVGRGSRDAFLACHEPFFEKLGIRASFELTPACGHPMSRTFHTPGLLYLQMPQKQLLDHLVSEKTIGTQAEIFTINDKTITGTNAEYAALFARDDKWQMLTTEWSADRPVAAVCKDGQTIVLFVNICASSTWNTFSAKQNTSTAQQALASIVQVAQPFLHSITFPPILQPEDAKLLSLISHVEQVKAIALSQIDRLDHELTRERQELAAQKEETKRVRELLVQALHTEQNHEEKIKAYTDGRQERIAESLEQAFVAVEQLGMLRAIRACKLEIIADGSIGLRIQTYDLALNTNEKTCRRLIPGLNMLLWFTTRGDFQVRFETRGCTTPSVHPHVSADGEACWGQAQMLLTEAASKRNWVIFTNTLIRWAATYNHASPYKERVLFPKTNLPAGWIIE